MGERIAGRASAAAQPQRLSLRGPLVALVILAGLFSMHGLTTEHNAAMAAMSSPAMSSPDLPAEAMAGMAAILRDLPELAMDVAAIAVGAEPAMTGMGATCVALLTGLLLLITGRLLFIRAGALGVDRAPADLRRWQATSLSRPPPDLAVLSILRT